MFHYFVTQFSRCARFFSWLTKNNNKLTEIKIGPTSNGVTSWAKVVLGEVAEDESSVLGVLLWSGADSIKYEVDDGVSEESDNQTE